jgi:hypothetical protein
MCRRRAEGPLAGVSAVAGGNAQVLPGLAKTCAKHLDGGRHRQNLDLGGTQLADQQGRDAVAQRVAGGQHGDRLAIGERRLAQLATRPMAPSMSAVDCCWSSEDAPGRACARRRSPVRQQPGAGVRASDKPAQPSSRMPITAQGSECFIFLHTNDETTFEIANQDGQ